MIKTIKTSALSLIVLGAIFTSCQSASEEIKMTDKEVAAEQAKIAEDAREKEIAEYETINKAKIEANEKSLAEFNARIKSEKLDAKADYEKKIAELDAKNSDMKKKMDEFHAGNKANWESFKASFDNDMTDLNKSFKDLMTKMGIGNDAPAK
jgi:chromosome segregation ATPase